MSLIYYERRNMREFRENGERRFMCTWYSTHYSRLTHLRPQLRQDRPLWKSDISEDASDLLSEGSFLSIFDPEFDSFSLF